MAHRRFLLDAYAAALAAVDARRCTALALRDLAPGPLRAIVAGKAAAGMVAALREAPQLEVVAAMVAAPERAPDAIVDDARWRWFRCGHPLPDAQSLAAGAAVLAMVAAAPGDARFLVLLSGGASALLEAPVAGVDLSALRALHSRLLDSGLAIAEINRERAAVSRLKGGGLAATLARRPTEVLFLSDVPGDDPRVVGGGPCAAADGVTDPAIPHRCIASNAQARTGALELARRRGIAGFDHGALAGDAAETGRAIAATAATRAPGLHAWGGECTVRVPADAGRGGRCQHLALAAAVALARSDALLLACGSDGRDGPGRAAGALVDGGTLARLEIAGIDAAAALARCAAGEALAASGDLVDTGPTGTNVADLVFLYRPTALGDGSAAPPPGFG